jgi:hypothetical protein
MAMFFIIMMILLSMQMLKFNNYCNADLDVVVDVRFYRFRIMLLVGRFDVFFTFAGMILLPLLFLFRILLLR